LIIGDIHLVSINCTIFCAYSVRVGRDSVLVRDGSLKVTFYSIRVSVDPEQVCLDCVDVSADAIRVSLDDFKVWGYTQIIVRDFAIVHGDPSWVGLNDIHVCADLGIVVRNSFSV